MVVINSVELARSSDIFSTRFATPDNLYPATLWAAAFGGRPEGVSGREFGSREPRGEDTGAPGEFHGSNGEPN